MLTIILIALGLNFDTFSVAVIKGAQTDKPSVKDILKIGFIFGIVQGFMALGGMVLGIGFKFIIANIDHWVAFILLELIGIKMILEKRGENSKNLFLLAIATSIDSLVVGITFAFLNIGIITSIFIIGAVTFLISSIGFYAGKKLRGIFKNKIKLAGGIILMLIGLKILVEHLN